MTRPISAARLVELSGEPIPEQHYAVIVRKVEEALQSYFSGLGLWWLSKPDTEPVRFDFDSAFCWLDNNGAHLIRLWVRELEGTGS